MMRGTSVDECVNLLGVRIGRTAAVLKKPHKATFNSFFSCGLRLKKQLSIEHLLQEHTRQQQRNR